MKWYHVCWTRLTAKRVEPVVRISWASCLTCRSCSAALQSITWISPTYTLCQLQDANVIACMQNKTDLFRRNVFTFFSFDLLSLISIWIISYFCVTSVLHHFIPLSCERTVWNLIHARFLCGLRRILYSLRLFRWVYNCKRLIVPHVENKFCFQGTSSILTRLLPWRNFVLHAEV